MNDVLRGLKDLVIEAIDKGATTTEDVFKSIANLPFETLVLLGDTAKSLKGLQEESIGKVYDIIHNLNQQVDEYAENLLEKLEKKAEQGKDTEQRKPKTAKPKPKAAKPKTKAAKPKTKSAKKPEQNAAK